MERALAGLKPAELRRRYRAELFEVVLPFWERHGVDHEHGGFLCALDHDGSLVSDEKFHWFQGRGIWVYSRLYHGFGRDPRHLEIARQAKDFLLRHAPQPDGWWAELLARGGRVLRPFSGDVYGMYFAAEGLQEYGWAAGDEEARRLASQLLKKLYAETCRWPQRPQGIWMMNLRIATQMLRCWDDPEIAAIADASLEAIVARHYNPAIGLNTETLNRDFTRPAGQENLCVFGHSIECLWMAMDEADRRGDAALWQTCAARLERHLEAAWDRVYGGLIHAANVDQGGFQWPVERPVGTELEFRFAGEYHHMKSLWSLNEALIATLMVYQRTRAEWAACWFSRVQQTIDEKFSLRSRGYPLYLLFTDRRFTFQPRATRQDNYHLPRQLMLCLELVDRM